MTITTQSGLTRRTVPSSDYGVHVTPTGFSVSYPPFVGRFFRPVRIRAGHRRADGSHFNTIANRVCLDCVLEAELEYLQTMWRATYTGKRPPP